MSEVEPAAAPTELPDQGGARPPVRRGLGFAAGSFLTSVVLGLGSSIVTSRLYGVDVIGEYALVSVPYMFGSQLSSVGEGTAFVREAAGLRVGDPRITALWRRVLGFSMLLTTTVGALALLVSALLFHGPMEQPDLVLPAAVVLAAYVLLGNVSWNIDHLLSAHRAASALFVARFAETAAFLVAGFVLSFVDDTVWGLVWATVAMFAVPFVVRCTFLPRYLVRRVPLEERTQARRDLPRLLRFGITLLPATIGNSITTSVGTWVVGSVATVAQTGAYARSFGLASKFWEAGFRISEILMPGMVERHDNGDRDGAAHLLNRTLRLAGGALLVVAAAGSGAAEGVLGVFGPGFEQGAGALAFLLTGYVLGVIGSVQGQGYLTWGRPGLVTKMGLIRTAIVALSAWPLTVAFGITGAGLSFFIGQLVAVVLNDRVLQRVVGRMAALGPSLLARLALVWVAGAATAWAVDQLSESIVVSVLALAAGAAVGGAAVLALGVLGQDERDQLLRLLRRVARRG
jgi:O-antigen/teichoic acid export membrane protein